MPKPKNYYKPSLTTVSSLISPTSSTSVISQRDNVIVNTDQIVAKKSKPPDNVQTSNDTNKRPGPSNEVDKSLNCDVQEAEHQEKTDKSNKSESFACSLCPKKFKHKSYFDYHLRTHTNERPFKCVECPKTFFERSKLNRHLSSCHNVPNSNCELEEDAEKSRTCPQCNKIFSRKEALQVHIKSRHQGNRPYKCDKCDKNFSGQTALKNHQKRHEGEKKFDCDKCGKKFLLQKYLTLHLKTTHKGEVQKYWCSVCKKGYHSGKDLRRHKLTHSSATHFKCSVCQTGFKRRDNLKRHLRLTHDMTPEQIESGEGLEVPKPPPQPAPINNTVPVIAVNQQTAAPLLNQVSVIKSTHEVRMSIVRAQQNILK